MIFTDPRQRALLVLLALFNVAHAETDAPISPERADAIFAWFDQLPLPGLHGTEFVRVWPGNKWKTSQPDFEPERFLAFLLEDGPMSFRVLTPASEEKTYIKHGAEPGEEDFIGFRTISLLDEARHFLSELSTPDDPYNVRERMFADTFDEFRLHLTDGEAADAALARWCAKAGDENLALSFLNAAHAEQLHRPGQTRTDSLEISLQKIYSTALLGRAYRAFADQKLLRPDLLANFQKIVALCPNADLSSEKEAIQILERMIREDSAHPPLDAGKLATLPPETRAQELVFRLRDENRQLDPVLRGAAAPPSNGALRDLEELGLAAAPALVQALDDDTFTREASRRFTNMTVSRVRDDALAALKVISGCNFVRSSTAVEYRSKSEADIARMWWRGVSEKGEKNYLMERIAAGDIHYADFASQLRKKYADEAVPFLIEQSRAATDLNERVTLSKALWNENDPRCLAFFATQATEGRELADRVTAAHGLRFLRDARAVSAMTAEWEKLVAAKAGSDWPVIAENDPNFANPWSVADFLATSNAPEASLCLGEHAAFLPVEWRAKIISRLADFALGRNVENADPPGSGAKKAIEDVLHGFLTDESDCPTDANFGADLIGAGRICDVAAQGLHQLWPQRYEFDRWLSPVARTRQCHISFNVRARELGEMLLPVPPESPGEPLDADAEKIVSDVMIAPPLDKTEFGGRIAALRGSPLDGHSLIAALTRSFSKPEKEMRGFVLTIARFRNARGVSIHLLPLVGQGFGPADHCQARIVAQIGTQTPGAASFTSGQTFERWADARSWQYLLQAFESVAVEPPQSAFTIGIHFNFQPEFRSVSVRAIPPAGLPNPSPK